MSQAGSNSIMPRRGKKIRAARARIPVGVTHTVAEGVTLVKTLSFAKFDESIEIATKLGVDPRRADQIVRGTVVLPHGTGKRMRVLVIAQGEKEREARDAGADYVGTEYLERIKQGWLEFDAVVAPYHDVAMAALKTVSFGTGVNVTLGLPFVRTSPDHGTAFDIAGRGVADATSALEALRLATRVAANRATTSRGAGVPAAPSAAPSATR